MGKRLFDTNRDGVRDARQFAGSHRYNTAVALAEQYVKDAGTISTVIVASGETEVDAVTASGLAGNLTAPVLLTRSNRLPHNVARFIDDHNVSTVIVVGGTAVVPDAIIATIESLGSKPTVEPVFGSDRYATAAAIGSRLGGPNPTWCGSTQTAAILVNGGDAGRADAVVAGPLANALGLPVLLTEADELPDSTAAFLTDEKVERVVIVGGESAVSADVEEHLVEIVGVTATQRIAGANAAATSVMVAKEMLGNCASTLNTNKDMVALVNRDATADGIAAAPTLGRGPNNSGPVPILLVGDTLPAEISDYLSSTLNERDGDKTDLRIVAIGGAAVVSEEVMQAAVDAAKTSDDLTVAINVEAAPLGVSKYIAGSAPVSSGGLAAAKAAGTSDPCPNAVTKTKLVGDYTCQFRVTFSDDVKTAASTATVAERRGTAMDPTMYYLNGRRLEGLLDSSTDPANDETTKIRDLVFTADRTVTVTLSHHLNAGDVITVDNSLNEAAKRMIGANKDKRKLQKAELKLPAVSPVRDTAAPKVEIIAVAGNTYFDVIVTEPNIGYNQLGFGSDGATLKDSGLTMATAGANVNDFITITGATIPADPKRNSGNLTGDAMPAGSLPTQRLVTVSGATSTQPAATASDHVVRMRFDVAVVNKIPFNSTDNSARYGQFGKANDATVDEAKLRAGDVITVKHGAVRDTANRLSLSDQFTVARVKTSPDAKYGISGALKLEQVSMGRYVHTVQARAQLGGVLRISALSSGVAAGAAGNSWVVFGYDDRRDGEASSDDFDIDVAVDKVNKRISYTISDKLPRKSIGRIATIEDLATELFGTEDFRSNFFVDYVRTTQGAPPAGGKDTPLGPTGSQGIKFGASGASTPTGHVVGLTSVGVVVKFNAPIESLGSENGDKLADDIAPKFPGAPGVVDTTIDDDKYNAAPAPSPTGPDRRLISVVHPGDTVYIRYTSDSMSELPTQTGFRVIEKGLATGYGDDTVSRFYGCKGLTRATCTGTDGAQSDTELAALATGVSNERYFLTNIYQNLAIPPTG